MSNDDNVLGFFMVCLLHKFSCLWRISEVTTSIRSLHCRWQHFKRVREIFRGVIGFFSACKFLRQRVFIAASCTYICVLPDYILKVAARTTILFCGCLRSLSDYFLRAWLTLPSLLAIILNNATSTLHFWCWGCIYPSILYHPPINAPQTRTQHVCYRVMHFSAKRGIAITCRLSVCLSVSVTLVNCDHIGWNSSKIISPLVSLGCSLFATPNMTGLLQKEHP